MQSYELVFEYLYDDGQNFWFTGRDYNALFRMDKKSWKPELAGIFPRENLVQRNLYSSIVLYNKRLYFAPSSANEIAEYDLITKKFQKISVPIFRVNNGQLWESYKFSNIAFADKKIYLIPFAYPGILCYDTEKGNFKYFDDWVDKIEKIRISEWGYFKDFELNNNKLVLPCLCADAVVILDVVKEETQIIKTPATNYLCRHCGIGYTGDYYYLVSADGTISKRKLNFQEEEIKTIKIPVSGQDGIEFYPVKYADGCIYLFPSKNSRGFIIDTRTDQVMPSDIFDDEKRFKGNEPLYVACESDGKKLYALTGNSHRLIIYDLYRGDKDELKLSPSEQDILIFKKEEFITQLYGGGVTESEDDSLTFMLDTLQTYDDFKEKYDSKREAGTGSKIYHTLIHER